MVYGILFAFVGDRWRSRYNFRTTFYYYKKKLNLTNKKEHLMDVYVGQERAEVVQSGLEEYH